ncbi:MAG: TolC family protein [Nitrospiraceae bacterium]|nr:TolC family protein [Nitrospiraceae bacterium]
MSIKPGETLTMRQCIGIALAKNPAIRAGIDNTFISENRVGEARSNYYPQVSISASQNEYSLPSGSTTGTMVNGSRKNITQSGFSGAASVTQNIYDSGRTSSQVKVQKSNLGASREDLKSTEENLVLAVKQAYYGLLQAMRNRDTAQEVVKQFGQQLKQAEAFHEAGVKPRYDVTTAEVNLSNAKLALIKAENAIKLARAALNNTMGVPNAPDYNIEDNMAYEKYGITFDEALRKAFENRPDLKSLQFRQMAAAQSIELAKTGYYPSIAGSASYGYTGDNLPLDHYWSAGVTVSLPLFNGFLTKYQVLESRNTLDLTKAAAESLRQNIYYEVQSDFLNLQEAGDSLATAKLSVRQATENLDIARGRYNYGVGSPIEVTDAVASYSTAQTAYTNALYNYKIAQALIEKAMGLYGGGEK